MILHLRLKYSIMRNKSASLLLRQIRSSTGKVLDKKVSRAMYSRRDMVLPALPPSPSAEGLSTFSAVSSHFGCAFFCLGLVLSKFIALSLPDDLKSGICLGKDMRYVIHPHFSQFLFFALTGGAGCTDFFLFLLTFGALAIGFGLLFVWCYFGWRWLHER